MIIHDLSIRINRSDWLIIQAQGLIEFGKEHNLASSFIYACLEARLALEKADLDIVLASIGPEERLEIIELSKPKNGIERQGKKIGALKERYQIFIVNVFKALDMQTNFYDFKKSKILQNKLSSYIHSYYFFETDMRADSLELKEIPELINNTEEFLRESSYVEGEGHGIRSIDLKKNAS